MNPKIDLKRIGNLTTPFMGKTRGEPEHPGVDFANKEGTPIPAFDGGTITTVRKLNNGFGNVVTLKDTGGNVHQYGHLQGALVKPGQVVKKGQVIAKMGKTGNSYSPSGGDPTHVDIRIATPDGKWKNPIDYTKK